MGRLHTSHPGAGELLRFADGEMSPREAKLIQSHLAACWQCRTELAEIQSTIGECVRYRDGVLRSKLPEPPAPWFDIQARFAELDESARRRSWTARAWEALAAAVPQPRRWAPVLAALLIVALVVDHLRNAPSVKAAELLEKASVAADARPAAPRQIRIRMASGTVTRWIDGTGSPKPASLSPEEAERLAGLRELFRKADYDWEDPLSAAAFASWRSGLTEKQDEVTTIRGARSSEARRYRIRTTTDASVLEEATLQLTVRDLRPVEGTLRFRGAEPIEMSEVDEPPAPPAEAPAEQETALASQASEPLRSARPEPPAPLGEAELSEPATPGEELMVLAALRRLGADLGEPVEVARDGGNVVVRGVGVSPAMREAIHEELSGLPRVEVQLSEPLPAPVAAPGRPLADVTLRPEIARLQAEIERQLGGRTAYEEFSDEVLALNDALMARVHALRRLGERFPTDTESRLDDEERRILAGLRREHAVALAGLAATLEERAQTALSAFGETPQTSTPSKSLLWQAATEALFAEARRAESLLAAMLGGAATNTPLDRLPAEALSSLARLRASAAAYVRNTL